MAKRPLALLLGSTGNLAFAAGCLLQALRRHSPRLEADIVLYTDGSLPPGDEALLRRLGATPVLYTPPEADFPPKALRTFTHIALARFEALRLLSRYRTVIWLDIDIALQGDITPLAAYGPFALALEDPAFSASGATMPASISITGSVPGFDPDAPNCNSGVLVFQDSLPDPEGLYRQCMEWLRLYAPQLTYMDQGIINLLAQRLRKQDSSLVRLLPHDRFNAHPRNPAAQHAAIVHAFGAYKLWDDGLTRCSFPEWERDYARWLDAGGSPWQGTVENAAYLEGGAFFMLKRLFDLTEQAQALLDRQTAELEAERLLRSRLEKALHALGSR